MKRLTWIAVAFSLFTVTGMTSATAGEPVGLIVRAQPALDAILAPDATIERLADGFRWSEGPVWIEDGNYWLFSDVPANRIYRWSGTEGLSVFLEPSGHAHGREGTNGLILAPRDGIFVGDHGNRAVARIDLATKAKSFLATHYDGKRFNSPNDLVRASDGSLYFTDPPYGLEGLDQSPHKELPFNGIYRLRPTGEVDLLDSKLSWPNGIIFSPDGRTLYVTQSDPEQAVIFAFDVNADGSLSGKRIFADLTGLVKQGLPGLPDGMAIDVHGNLFATGPGGVHVFNPAGKPLGRIDTGKAVANVAFGEDGATLFITSSDFLARVRTNTIGIGFQPE